MDDEDNKLPGNGNQLFGPADDWKFDARINSLDADFDFYAEGYKIAAHTLVKYVLTNKIEQDFLIYPIVFLYRHHIELQLKIIIQDGSQLLGKPRKYEKNHKIDELWEEARQIVEKIWPDGSKERLDKIGGLINQFAKVDEGSFTFRYPTDRNDQPSLPDLRRINLKKFSSNINKIADFLDGVTIGISSALDA